MTEQDGENARRALARLHHDDPKLVAWIAAGAPNMTDAEHVERFGEPYSGVKSRRFPPA